MISGANVTVKCRGAQVDGVMRLIKTADKNLSCFTLYKHPSVIGLLQRVSFHWRLYNAKEKRRGKKIQIQ